MADHTHNNADTFPLHSPNLEVEARTVFAKTRISFNSAKLNPEPPLAFFFRCRQALHLNQSRVFFSWSMMLFIATFFLEAWR